MDYRKLNTQTHTNNFPMSLDQMLDRLTGRGWYCFLDSYSGYNQIFTAPKDQEKTTFTFPYRTFAFKKMSFDLCNAPTISQSCMMSIFSDIMEDTIKVFMDNFSGVYDLFDDCELFVQRLAKM